MKKISDHLGNRFLMFSGVVPSSLVNPASDGCVRETLTDGLDLIFTDIMGVLIIAERSGPDYSLHKFVFLRVLFAIGIILSSPCMGSSQTFSVDAFR